MQRSGSKSHIYIATPGYGGAVATCYVNGLLDLLDVGHRHGVTFTVGFNNFESPVTARATRWSRIFWPTNAAHI